jgi:hypothetical protein
MKRKSDQNDSVPNVIRDYRESIPRDLRDILVPETDQDESFAGAIKLLKMIEAERNYVRELQDYYKVPIRPNDSVKRTMIRVRLNWLKKIKARSGHGHVIEMIRDLPIDPLE